MRGCRVLKLANDFQFDLVAGIESPCSLHVILLLPWLSFTLYFLHEKCLFMNGYNKSWTTAQKRYICSISSPPKRSSERFFSPSY